MYTHLIHLRVDPGILHTEQQLHLPHGSQEKHSSPGSPRRRLYVSSIDQRTYLVILTGLKFENTSEQFP